MIFDLHSHTTFSDGALTPRELLARADEKGVDVLAITDHDTTDAFDDLPSDNHQVSLVPGIEFSTQWNKTGVHVIGLNIDPGSDAMSHGVRYQSNARLQRARLIGERLRKKGIKDAFEGAARLSAGSYIGRPHFARHLVNTGRVDSIQAAFKKYMGDGKVGDIKQHWADLPQVIRWIRDANGVAVLAHPLKYKMTRTRLKKLIVDFIDQGGQGIEVISGQQQPQQTRDMAQLCVQHELLASCGSDFHRPDSPWAELGAFSPLPGNVRPVWDSF